MATEKTSYLNRFLKCNENTAHLNQISSLIQRKNSINLLFFKHKIKNRDRWSNCVAKSFHIRYKNVYICKYKYIRFFLYVWLPFSTVLCCKICKCLPTDLLSFPGYIWVYSSLFFLANSMNPFIGRLAFRESVFIAFCFLAWFSWLRLSRFSCSRSRRC